MKILSITAQKPNSTGSGVYLTELVKQFQKKGHQQAVVAGIYKEDEVVLPEGVEFAPVYFETEQLPFPIVGMSDEMPYTSTRYRDMTEEMTEQFAQEFLKVITEVVEKFQPDLILCHHLYLLTALVREHFPQHKIYGFCHNTDLRQMQKTDLKREYIASQIQKLDRIFVPQQAQQDGVMNIYHYPENQIKIVGMGYNSEIFYRTEKEPKQDAEKVRMIYAGKLSEKKGVISLLRSLEHLSLPADKLELWLAGGAGNEKEYAQICSLAQNAPYEVKILGRLAQEELAKAYNQSDIFILPSFFDGLPLTVIEALACGDRVIITELPGIREWLTGNVIGGDICYVELPTMQNADEPCEEELPEFEKRLARTIEESVLRREAVVGDVSHISWSHIAEIVME